MEKSQDDGNEQEFPDNQDQEVENKPVFIQLPHNFDA